MTFGGGEMTTERGCTAWMEQLCAFHDGQLSAVQRQGVEAHLDGCAGCRAALAQLEADRTQFVAAYANATGGAALRESVLDKLKSEKKPPVTLNMILRRLQWAGSISGAVMVLSILLLVMLSRSALNPAMSNLRAPHPEMSLFSDLPSAGSLKGSSSEIAVTFLSDHALTGADHIATLLNGDGGIISDMSHEIAGKARTWARCQGQVPLTSAQSLLLTMSKTAKITTLTVDGKDINGQFDEQIDADLIPKLIIAHHGEERMVTLSALFIQGNPNNPLVVAASEANASPPIFYGLILLAALSALALITVVFIAPRIVVRRWELRAEQNAK